MAKTQFFRRFVFVQPDLKRKYFIINHNGPSRFVILTHCNERTEKSANVPSPNSLDLVLGNILKPGFIYHELVPDRNQSDNKK